MMIDGKISLAVLAGDGIGPEITDATVRVLQAAARRSALDLALTPYPIGWKAYEKSRSTLMPETVAALRNHMGWILGPTFAGEYPKDDPINEHPSGYLRRNFALFANVRPVQAWPQADPLVPDLDITILRENTEGFYPDRNLAWGYASSSRPRMSGCRCGSSPRRPATALPASPSNMPPLQISTASR
jgi:3-isopropylmalate dehydrogenase